MKSVARVAFFSANDHYLANPACRDGAFGRAPMTAFGRGCVKTYAFRCRAIS